MPVPVPVPVPVPAPAPTPAPPPDGPPAPPDSEPILEIHLGDSMDIAELLKVVSGKTGKPIVWSDQDKTVTGKKIQGSIDIRSPRSKLFETVRALLTFQDIVLIPIGAKGYEIYVAMDARTLSGQFILKNKPVYVDLTEEKALEIEGQDGLFVAATIKVKNLDNLRDARTALQRIITPQNIGSVQEVPAARAFVVTDFAPNVVAIYRLLREMDVQPEGKKVKQEYLTLQYALAEDIEPILQDLFTGKQRLSQPQPNQPGGSDIVDPEPRIISDARTNQIIVYATEDDIAEIRALVEHLDTKLIYPNPLVYVIQLKNLEAEETAQVLTTLIDGTSLFGSTGGSLGSGSTGTRRTGSTGRTTTTQNRPATANPSIASSNPENQEKPAVVADKASNSLIIAASKEQYDRLRNIIDQIDIRKSQVLIEAALVELSLDDSFKFAVELAGLDNNGLDPHGNLSGFFGTSFGLTQFAGPRRRRHVHRPRAALHLRLRQPAARPHRRHHRERDFAGAVDLPRAQHDDRANIRVLAAEHR